MRCLLHIGTHKTGTTSIQHFLRHHVGAPSFPVGMIHPDTQTELASVAARPERIDMSITNPEMLTGPWRRRATEQIRSQVASDVEHLIYSSELLSLLCHDDEVATVMRLLEGRDVGVVMYTRNPADFLESYRFTIGLFGLEPPTRPDAINDLSVDSWLVDYQSRIDLWARHAPVTVIDYDEVVARDGSVIPSFAGLVGVPPVDYRLNTTDELRAKVVEAIRSDPAALEKVRKELGDVD
jgi:hypothetical protein